MMRVTIKGQVTIPRGVRDALGIPPETEIEFVEDDGKFYIIRTNGPRKQTKFNKFRGIATANMSTDEIMKLTRE